MLGYYWLYLIFFWGGGGFTELYFGFSSGCCGVISECYGGGVEGGVATPASSVTKSDTDVSCDSISLSLSLSLSFSHAHAHILTHSLSHSLSLSLSLFLSFVSQFSLVRTSLISGHLCRCGGDRFTLSLSRKNWVKLGNFLGFIFLRSTKHDGTVVWSKQQPVKNGIE